MEERKTIDTKSEKISKDDLISKLQSEILSLKSELTSLKQKFKIKKKRSTSKTTSKLLPELIERCDVGFINVLSFLSTKDVLNALSINREVVEFVSGQQR